MRRGWLLSATLFLTFFVFLPTVRYSFVFDDVGQIVENPRLTAWKYVPGYFVTHLWSHLQFQPANYYRPIFLIWLRLTYALLGPPTPIWHLTSILAHLCATVSVFLLIRRLTGEFKGAALATGLFAIHPVHTEAVAWISAVSEPLLTTFLVLSVYFYAGRRRPISFVSLVLAALAILTKEVGIVAPALILAYEWTRSPFKTAVVGATPYILPLLLCAALRMHAVGTSGSGMPVYMSISGMILSWPRVLALYGGHLVWPIHLSECYDVPVETAAWPLLLLIAAIAVLTRAIRKCSANVRFGTAWFAITIAPCMALRYMFFGDFVHDRYLYLPSVGLAITLAAWLSHVRLTILRAIAASVVAVALCIVTRYDLRIWQDNISLFGRAVETAPHNPYAKNSLAIAYIKVGRIGEAEPLLKQAIALNPAYWKPYYNLGRCYQLNGNDAEAQHYFSVANQVYQSDLAQGNLR